MYTDEKNAQIVLALFKKYNIKKIVVSPGRANVPVVLSVQRDSFFEVYSIIDERSAAYFAIGLAFDSGEPVVISCTGSTASRNYLSGLTEAYYRNLPIIALTSQRNERNDFSSLQPQLTNRTVSQLDVKRISVDLPIIQNKKDEECCVLNVNKALTFATKRGCGPVHINLTTEASNFTTTNLPNILKIDFYQTDDLLCDNNTLQLKNQLIGKKIGLLIGSHKKFLQKEIEAIENFINSYDVVVFCDHTSNYHWKNKVLISVASDLKYINIKSDLIIDIGGITGDYSAQNLFQGSEFWRISEDGEFHQRYGNLKKQFDCPESIFFNRLSDKQIVSQNGYYNAVIEKIGEVIIPDLPLSNTFISYQMSKKIPNKCSLHLAINNCLRNMNFFELHESIDCNCNVGGFGIDGPVSTLIGQSMINRDRLYFGQVGDLAFFYDMNALGIRHISNNIRILLINNGRGVEFRLIDCDKPFGDELDKFVAASGHYCSARAWAMSVGFEYLAANDKNEFLSIIDDFCSPNIGQYSKPVLFEVFTKVKDEQESLKLIRDANRPKNTVILNETKSKIKNIAEKVLSEKAIKIIKTLKE